MNKQLPYDPEDLEALMLNKSFDELLPDERTFVLQHFSGKKEYESMRQLLFQSMESMQENKSQPPGALKDRMIHEFRQHHQSQSRSYVWLNFLAQFWNQFKSRPVIQIAAACVAVLFVVVLWNPFPGDSELADSIVKEQADKSESAEATEEKKFEKEAQRIENEVNQDSELETKTSSPEIDQSPSPPTSPAEEVVTVEEDLADVEESEYSARNAAPAAASDQFEDALTDSAEPAKKTVSVSGTENINRPTRVELIDDALLSVLFTAR